MEASRPLPVLALKFLLEEAKDSPVTLDEAHQNYDEWRIRLNRRCRNLLQATDLDSKGFWERPFKQHVPFTYYEVNFLHTTVSDFLQDNYHEMLLRHCVP